MNKNQIIESALLKNVGGGFDPCYPPPPSMDICKANTCRQDTCGHIGSGAAFWANTCTADTCQMDICRT